MDKFTSLCINLGIIAALIGAGCLLLQWGFGLALTTTALMFISVAGLLLLLGLSLIFFFIQP